MDRLILLAGGVTPVIPMAIARQNPAAARVQSWAEEVRAAEFDRAVRQLQTLGSKDKRVLESLSRRLVSELLAPTTAFVVQTSETLPNSKRLPILCEMFERQGAACPGSHCSAAGFAPGTPPGDYCEMATVAAHQRGERRP